MNSDTEKLPAQKKINPVKTIVAILILIVVGLWLFGKLQDSLKSKVWTLFIYSSENPDSNNLLNRLDNLDSKDVCITTGVAYTEKFGSYECGYNCRFSDKYLTEICEKTCDHGGCRN